MKRNMAFLLAVAGLGALTALTPPGGLHAGKSNITTVAQYEGIATPAIDRGELTILALTWGQPAAVVVGPAFLMLEAWRVTSLSVLGALEDEMPPLDNPKKEKGGYTAAAITTNTVKDLRVGIEAGIQSAKYTIGKLKADLKWYEDNVNSRFANDNFKPSDPDELRMWERYQAIKQAMKRFEYTAVIKDRTNPAAPGRQEQKVLTDAEQTLDEKAKACKDGLLEVLARVNKAQYALASLRVDQGFMQERMEALNETVFGIEQMALALNENGKTPRKQLRATFTNQSKDLVFFLQVAARGDGGDYTIRPDTRYPITLYPDVSHETKEVLSTLQLGGQRQGQRGPSRVFVGLGLKDKIIVRAATMGIVRDRLRFMVIKGKNIRPELNSLSRGFYYLGYEAPLPAGTLVSRWYSDKESYAWSFRGGWAPGSTANDPVLKNSSGAELRESGLGVTSPNLALTGDRMEWVLPAGLATAADLGKSWAEVEGSATYTKLGPTTVGSGARGGTIPETGSGKLQMMLELW